MERTKFLALHYDGYVEMAQKFFRQMNASNSYREVFFNNPAEVLAHTVLNDTVSIPSSQINRANLFLYALLSNKKFMDWTKHFQEKVQSDIAKLGQGEQSTEAIKSYLASLTKQKLYEELINGMQSTIDRETWNILLVKGTGPGTSVKIPDVLREIKLAFVTGINQDVAVEIETLIYAVDVAAVFVVIVAVFGIPVSAELTREDLAKLSNLVSSRLREIGAATRAAGGLSFG